jgi:hypothetical protein
MLEDRMRDAIPYLECCRSSRSSLGQVFVTGINIRGWQGCAELDLEPLQENASGHVAGMKEHCVSKSRLTETDRLTTTRVARVLRKIIYKKVKVVAMRLADYRLQDQDSHPRWS